MSNALFTFMFKSWSMKEIWDIANKPEDYVIALSELIEKQFEVIGYTTERNHVGEIYFKQKDKLAPAGPGSPGYQKHKENAQIIAFYFVRLFQIMGALLLVVKDINFPVFNQARGINEYSANITSVNRPITSQGLPRFSYKTMSGGGSFPKDTPLGPYEFLRKILQKPSSEDIASYQTRFSADLKDKYMITPNLFFKYNVDLETNRKRVQPKEYTKSSFFILTKDSTIGSKLFVKKDSIIQSINMGTGGLPQFKTPESLDNEKELYPITVSIGLPTSGTKTMHSATFTRIDPKDDDWKGGLDYYISEGTKMDDILGRLDRKDFTKVLQEVVLGAVRQENPNLRLYEIAPVETTGKAANVGQIPDKIAASSMINELLQGLKGKQQPHCIARALQLLDSASIQAYSPGGAVTQICKFAVGDIKSGVLGPAGLDAYKPMKSVAQLYGKINPANFKESQKVLQAFVGSAATLGPIGVKDLKGMKQDEEAQELSGALDRLAKAFEFVHKDPLDSFSQIQLSRPKECKTNESMKVMNQQTVIQMQSAAQRLLAEHLNKTIMISKFLKKVFNISEIPGEDGPRWKVEGPRAEILFAGFPVLDELTKQARALLIDYYSGCEEIYQGGLKAWKNSDEAKGPVKPAAAAVVPASPVSSSAPGLSPGPPAAPVVSVPASAPAASAPIASPVTGGRRR